MLDILQTIILLAYLAREIKDFSPGDLCYEKQVTCYSRDAKKLNLWNLRNLSEGGRVDAVDFLCAVLPQVLLSYSVRPCLWPGQLLSPSHLSFFRLASVSTFSRIHQLRHFILVIVSVLFQRPSTSQRSVLNVAGDISVERTHLWQATPLSRANLYTARQIFVRVWRASQSASPPASPCSTPRWPGTSWGRSTTPAPGPPAGPPAGSISTRSAGRWGHVWWVLMAAHYTQVCLRTS